MPACRGLQATVPDADVDNAASLLGYLYIVSQYTVRLMTPCVWRILCLRNSSSVTYFCNHRIYQLQHAETESVPIVARLLSAETECPPKVLICPNSAPKPKPKPKFGRPLAIKLVCADSNFCVVLVPVHGARVHDIKAWRITLTSSSDLSPH